MKSQKDTEQNKFSIANITKSDLIVKKTTQKQLQLEGYSLFCLQPTNYLRVLCARIIEWKHYDNIIILAILVSTISLSIDSPLNDPNSDLSLTTWFIDIAMTIVFTIEALTKIVVLGFLFNGKQSYLRDYWSIIDFLTVVTSLASFFGPRESTGLSFFKVFRVIRFLRPLRIIQKNPGLKIAVQSLINAMPGIFNLLIICGSFLIIFAILGVNVFKGVFYSCDMSNIPESLQGQVTNYWECLDYGGEWVNSDNNFDDLGQGLKTQIAIMCTEGWIQIF